MDREVEQDGWFKSSYSGAHNPSCLEARLRADGIEVRDSKDPDGAVLRFGFAAWGRFLRRVAG
ncbi:DUF397 domain-containing protein [Saccharopolyspora rosea]|uniref:DUF397 domain-containing protein n=1 Tax=Saccharopolyspora rosea TaxID=524884 RepID=A0ABW3FXQ3_9PSEU|nr:DUF397 domain-containing protein [Saccharopolyspora rosea]